MVYSLVLDDERKLEQIKFPSSFVNQVLVKDYDSFVKTITSSGVPASVSFDFDLTPSSYKESSRNNFRGFDFSRCEDPNGFHCAKFLIKHCRDKQMKLPKWYVHSANPYGRELIRKILQKYE